MFPPGSHISDRKVVATSLFASLSDVVFNLVAALITGSTVMLSQALQGLFDFSANSALSIGVQRSSRKADASHQLGYGREIFFWVLVCSVFMFTGTGGLSFYFGYQQFVHPQPLRNLTVAFGVLILGLVMSAYSLSLSLRRLGSLESDKRWLHQLFNSSVVETKTTLLIDTMGLAAAIFGLTALSIYGLTHDARYDGVGSMVIGISMMLGVTLLIRDVSDLIVGRSANAEISAAIKRAALSVTGTVAVLDLLTLYIGSGKLLAILEIHLQDNLDTDQIEQIIDAVKAAVMKQVPLVRHVQVELETPEEAAASLKKQSPPAPERL